MKYCPFKMANSNLPPQEWHCEQEACQIWSERFGTCNLAVDAYLTAGEDWLAEKRAEREAMSP